MSKKIKLLNPGDLVKLNENGVPTPFIFLEYNHYGCDEVTLIRKQVSNIMMHSAYVDHKYGYTSSTYVGSNPDNYCITYGEQLAPAVNAALCYVPIPIYLGRCVAGGEWRGSDTLVTIPRKCFCLSLNELNITTFSSAKTEGGTPFTYFSSNPLRVSVVDGTDAMAAGYWTRTISKVGNDDYCYATFVGYTGEAGATDSGYLYSVRPAITLTSEILVSNTVDSDGCYTIDDVVVAGEGYQKVNGTWRRTV